MTAQQMTRLVENITQDGGLTSLPLVHTLGDGTLEIISGHHRVQAAIQAHFAEIKVIVILTEMSEKRITALQLSHNAITGQDDKSILGELYQSLDLEERKYSGLTDDYFANFDGLGLASLGVGAVKYEDLRVSFLPEDKQEFLDFVKRIESFAKKNTVLVASMADFDQFFATVIAVKDKLQIHNAALALRMMAELALERIGQLEDQADAGAN